MKNIKLKVSSWPFLLAWFALLMIIIAVQGCASVPCGDADCSQSRLRQAAYKDNSSEFVCVMKKVGRGILCKRKTS